MGAAGVSIDFPRSLPCSSIDTPHPLSLAGAMKSEAWGVIYNAADVRLGRVSLSMSAFIDMQVHKLNLDMLEETFRYGKEIEPGKIELQFGKFAVGMFYVKDETRTTRGNLNLERFVITACWKRGGRHV